MLLRGLPIEDYSKDELGMIFWGIGTHLGRGLSQSVMGDRLGHVKDFSREDPGARAYRNKGGYIFIRVSIVRTSSSLSSRWWGVTSALTRRPRCLARAIASTDAAQLRC